MSRGRTFSREFKLAAVQEVINGAKRPAPVFKTGAICHSATSPPLVLPYQQAPCSRELRPHRDQPGVPSMNHH